MRKHGTDTALSINVTATKASTFPPFSHTALGAVLQQAEHKPGAGTDVSGFTFDMSLSPRSMRGGGFLSRMPASYGDTMAGLMKRRNMALPTAPMLFWGKRWLTTCARTITHNSPALSNGQGLPKASHGKPSQSILSTPIMLNTLEWDSLASQRTRTRRKGVGLSDSSWLSSAAAQLPWQGHGSQSSWPRLKADPTQVPQPQTQVCTALSQHREHLPLTGSRICVCNCTTETQASPAITLLYSCRSNFPFVRRSSLQKYPSKPSPVHNRTEGARAEWPVHSSAYTYTV